MLRKMRVHMRHIKELLHVRDLALRIEPHQVHALYGKWFLYPLIKGISQSSIHKMREVNRVKMPEDERRRFEVDHQSSPDSKGLDSPFLVVQVPQLSTAAQGESPPPMTVLTSILIVSICKIGITRS